MKKVILAIIGIIVLVLIGFGARYFLAYNSFLNKITERKPEMKEYSVLVLENSELKDSSSLNGKSVGFLKTDPMFKNAEKKLTESIPVVTDSFEDINLLIETLESGITDAMAIETNRLEILKEESKNEAIEKMRVIYTFEIELESEPVDVSDKEITTEPFILYISGSDARNGINEVARSDVNIVAVVNPKQGKILLASIPRDTYVQLHDTTGIKDKLTHAGLYGINMSKTTIEDFLNIDIDYTLKVSFDTVIRVVDQLDGIDIFSDNAMTLKTEQGKVCEYIYGEQHIDGDCALRFARERKSYYTGDKHRGQNQQVVLTAIINRLSGSKDYLLKLPTILDIAADSFETSISRDNISSFIRMQLTNPINWKVESIAVDGTATHEPTYSMGTNLPLYVMIPDETSVNNVVKKINDYLATEEESEGTKDTEAESEKKINEDS